MKDSDMKRRSFLANSSAQLAAIVLPMPSKAEEIKCVDIGNWEQPINITMRFQGVNLPSGIKPGVFYHVVINKVGTSPT